MAFHACGLLGVIVTTLNPLYTADEVAHQLKHSKARFVLTVSMFTAKVQEAAAKGAPIEGIFQFDAVADGAGDESVPVTPFTSLLAKGDAGLPEVEVNGDDVCAIPYSSGTSGLPKGVLLTHRNLIANIVQIMTPEHVVLSPSDVLVGVLPFFHIYGMVIVLNVSLVYGAKTVTMPKFDPGLFLKILKVHGVTVAHGSSLFYP